MDTLHIKHNTTKTLYICRFPLTSCHRRAGAGAHAHAQWCSLLTPCHGPGARAHAQGWVCSDAERDVVLHAAELLERVLRTPSS